MKELNLTGSLGVRVAFHSVKPAEKATAVLDLKAATVFVCSKK